IKIAPNTFPQTFNTELSAVLRLNLYNAVSVKEKKIAWRKLSFGSLKLRVWNDAYRRPGGIATKRDRLHFTRTSARVQWRGVTRAGEARDLLFHIAHPPNHPPEN